ncbi:MAG: class I SAM-dependent methyltransferase [Gemmatimonadota bacterium]
MSVQLREPVQIVGDTPTRQHTLGFRDFRHSLFGLYERRGVHLEHKEMPWTLGTTWGYWLGSWNGKAATDTACAASIGEDEIRLFHDVCELTDPATALVIGHSFGLSTFCLALAAPAARVVALDNWSDVDSTILQKPLTEAILASGETPNVHLHEGESPRDLAAAIECAGISGTLDLVFIDGMHTDQAAAADFAGLRPWLGKRTIVFWHNVHLTGHAFHDGAGGTAARLYDVRSVLRTHGPMGIYYSSEAHPLLNEYLRAASLFWPEWRRYVHLTSHERELIRFESIRSGAPWRAMAAVGRPLRHLARMLGLRRSAT